MNNSQGLGEAFKEAVVRLPDPVVDFLRFVRAGFWKLREYPSTIIPPSPVRNAVEFTQSAPINARFLISTSSGLLCYDYGNLHTVLRSYYWGITRYGSRWYAFRRHVAEYSRRATGQIISFQLTGPTVANVRIERNFIDHRIHQIDAWGGHLYLMDTGNNRIIRYKIVNSRLRDEHRFYPNGVLTKGKQSENYSHMNSIYRANDSIFVMYHNYTTKTGKKSQIAVFDNSLRTKRIIDTCSGDAHNIVRLQDGTMYCDSKSGRLIWGDTTLECGYFTRGLAVNKQFVLVGGNEFSEGRKQRYATTAHIFAYDTKTKRKLAQIRLPGVGSIYELRLVEPRDQAMSSEVEKLNMYSPESV